MSEQRIPTGEPVDYATPGPAGPPRVWAATLVLIGGLVLVGLGGCFLIGVVITIQHIDFSGVHYQAPLSTSDLTIAGVLFLLALGAFAGAGVMLFFATRALLRVARM